MIAEFSQPLASIYQPGTQPLILDARPESEYMQRRLSQAVNIPLLSLTSRCYLLPDKGSAFAVVVPSATCYTVTTDQQQHGVQDEAGAVAVYLKGAASLQDFLNSRGWSNVTCYLQDIPGLWQAAADLEVLEQGAPADPHTLARRCLFAPSPLLAATVDGVEALLLAQFAPEQLLQGRCVFRALDVGCGSGRDVAWLASRRPGLTAAGHTRSHTATPHQQPPHWPAFNQHDASSAVQDEGDDTAPPQQAVAAKCVVQWRVTGVDEWLGALERAADLAAAMQLSAVNVSLVYARICGETGEIQPLQLPKSSRLRQCRLVPQAAEHILMEEGDAAAQTPVGVEPNFNLILCSRCLVRAVLPQLRKLLAPGGFLLYCTFLDLPGVQAFGRPSGADHLLQPGELATHYFGPQHGFVVHRDEVVYAPDGRELCWFVAQKGM